MVAGEGRVTGSQIDRPQVGWWIAVLGGMIFLAALAFDPGAYAQWCAHVTAALPQPFLRWLFGAAVLTHMIEATYALRLAQRHGLRAGGWLVQTALLGYPSLRLLRRRIAG